MSMVIGGAVQMDATPGQCSPSYYHYSLCIQSSNHFCCPIFSFCTDGVVGSTEIACGKDPCQLTQTDCSLIHAQLSPYAQTPVWQDQSLVLAGQPFPGTSTTPRVSSARCSSTEGAKGTGTTLRP